MEMERRASSLDNNAEILESEARLEQLKHVGKAEGKRSRGQEGNRSTISAKKGTGLSLPPLEGASSNLPEQPRPAHNSIFAETKGEQKLDNSLQHQPRKPRRSFVRLLVKRASFGLIDYEPPEPELVLPQSGVNKKQMVLAAILVQKAWKAHKQDMVAAKWSFLIKLDKREKRARERNREVAMEKRERKKQGKLEEEHRLALM